MNYLGDFAPDATVYCMYNTTDQGGASVSPTTDGTIRVYKDASTTQRSSPAGITLVADFDSAADLDVGVHHVTIDLSDDTDSGFYAAGHEYFIVLDEATIDGQNISCVIGQFSILNRSQSKPAQAAVVATLTGTPTTTTLASTSELYNLFEDDVFNGRRAYVLTGTYKGESSEITAFVKATGTLTVNTLPGGAPSAGDIIVIL